MGSTKSSVSSVDDMVPEVASDLSIGDAASECHLALRYAKEGCEVILDKGQDPDGKLYETLTKNYGLHEVEDLDDATVALAFPTDDNNSIISADAIIEPCCFEEDPKSNFKGQASASVLPDGVQFRFPRDGRGEAFKGEAQFPSSESQPQSQKIEWGLYFRKGHGSEGNNQWVRLVLNEYEFGVDECFDNDDKRGWFVHKMTIEVKPHGEWKNKFDQVSADPTPKPKNFTYTTSNTIGGAVAASPSSPFTATFQHQDQRNVTTPEYVWKPVQKSSDGVFTWTWEMLSWENGDRFTLKRLSRFAWGHLPKLPYDPRNFAQGRDDFVAEARWRIPNMEEEDLGSVGWDIELQMHVAFVKKGWKVGRLWICPKPKTRVYNFPSRSPLMLQRVVDK